MGAVSQHFFAATQPNYCNFKRVFETKNNSKQTEGIYVSFYAVMNNKAIKFFMSPSTPKF